MTLILFKYCCIIQLIGWLSLLAASEFNAFEEHLLFQINWPGPGTEDLFSDKSEENSIIIMTTIENEQYKCTLPVTMPSKNNEEETYSGPSALELIRPLMAKDSCIYKLEQYWAYELCHGSHLRQFHDEKETGKESAMQEYYLGRYDIGTFEGAVEDFSLTAKITEIPRIKLDGHHFPYVSINMTGGTVCDLNGKARVTRVKYICYPALKHQIYSLEETATCEYDILVFTYLLCKHPDYSLKTPETNEINCHSVGGTPSRPLVLEELESESYELNPQSIKLEALKKQFEVFEESKTLPSSKFQENIPETTTRDEQKLIREFLNGEHCLYGKSGWWKYEFCYGKKVEQYHQEADGSKTIILLGTWNRENHLEWVKKNPHKKPKSLADRKHVSHFYSNGQTCASEMKLHRHVEVRLKCQKSSHHPDAVSMTLLEPLVCEYILVIESPIICLLLPQADENGLIENSEMS